MNLYRCEVNKVLVFYVWAETLFQAWSLALSRTQEISDRLDHDSISVSFVVARDCIVSKDRK